MEPASFILSTRSARYLDISVPARGLVASLGRYGHRRPPVELSLMHDDLLIVFSEVALYRTVRQRQLADSTGILAAVLLVLNLLSLLPLPPGSSFSGRPFTQPVKFLFGY